MVLTFRNVHNWMKGNYAPEMFEAMFRALRPGGVLGVVEHRAKKGTTSEKMVESGYVTEAHVKKLAKDAGFRFDGSSEINANPKDTADHPAGVWTLPPTLRLGERNRAGYLAIGESDRMTFRFTKPEKKERTRR
jgi:predicted methyltransferase